MSYTMLSKIDAKVNEKYSRSRWSDAHCREIASWMSLPKEQRRETISMYTRTFKISKGHFYKLAERGGWKSGRKKRSDAGKKRKSKAANA